MISNDLPLDQPVSVLKTLFSQAHLGLVIADQEGRILAVNDRLAEMFESRATRFEGASAAQFWEGPRPQPDNWLQLMRQGGGRSREVLCRSTAGHIFPLSMRWHDSGPPQHYLIGTFEDQTQHHRRQSELMEQRDRAERYLDISRAMILALDPHGKVTEINRRGCQLLGRPPSEILGRDWFELAVPASLRKTQREIHQRLLTEELDHPRDIDSQLLCRDGQIRHMSWNHELVRNELNEIVGTLSSGQDNTQRKLAEEQILEMAMTDPLTGLVNRRSFYQRFEEALKIADRNQIYMAVIALDLDRFKQVNDRFGHAAGDRVLIRVADILKQTFRDSDTVGRMGGDEFAVLAVGSHRFEQLQPPLRRLLQALEEPMDIEGYPVTVGTSIGIALFPDHGKIPDELMSKADQALYEAKKQGKNRIQLYDVDSEPPDTTLP